MTNDHDEQIRQRAHELWERDGRPEGRHEEHWSRAREEIEAEAGLSRTEAAQMASLRGSSPDPAQAAPAPRSRRSRVPSDAPATKTTRRTSAQDAATPEPSSKAAKRGTKFQGNLPSELGGPRGKKEDTPPAPKYRHPENLNLTWSGRGRQPTWIREAVEAGRTLSDFEIGA